MNRDAMLKQFLDLTPSNKIMMLLIVSFNLTIVGRDIFSGSDESAKRHYAKGMLEINHQITQNVISRLTEGASRYPDDVFINMLCDILESYQLEPHLHEIWDNALKKLH